MANAEEFCHESARQFIRTVVFVDDEIYGETGPLLRMPATQAKSPKTRQLAGKRPRQTNCTDISEQNAISERPFGLHDMATAFADKGIVCSLHQPEDQDALDTNSPTYKVCRSADVSVLDWDMGGDNGEKTKRLICALAGSDEPGTPTSLRLIIVYTKRDNLFGVTNEILTYTEKYAHIEMKAFPSDTSGEVRYLQYETLRIVPIGKPGIRQTAGVNSFVVSEKSLPERVIEEFAGFASGLLQSAVLRQIAAVRENTPKLLSRFSQDMDVPFVIHWELLHSESHSERDVGQHVVAMFSSEVDSVVSDTVISGLVADLAGNYDSSHIECVRKLGVGCLNKEIKNKLKREMSRDDVAKQRSDSLTNLYCRTCLSQDPCGRFAVLMSNKTVYKPTMRKLQLGTIVREGPEDSGAYYICLQPVCDSVRLSGDSKFLFHKLTKDSQKGNMVVVENGNPLFLQFKPDVQSLDIRKIEVGNITDGSVIANDQGIYQLETGNKFTWLAQLNTEHSIRFAQMFAQKLSRVGLTESEWLRILSK